MTDFIDADIQNALMTQLTVPTLGYPIAFPLVPFSPAVGVSFLQVWPLLKTQTQHIGLGYLDSNIERGIFQVDAVIPDGQGEPLGLRIMAKIAERFAIGTVLIAGIRKLKINAVPQTASGMKDGAWVRFPVSIAYILIT